MAEVLKYVYEINGPVVKASGDGDFAAGDMVYVGHSRLLGEVINIDEYKATIQVYESTTGLKAGEEVVSTCMPLCVTLAPGIAGNIFDGIQRPLSSLCELSGDFMAAGCNCESLDTAKLWHFRPCAEIGDSVGPLSIIGCVPETGSMLHKVMIPCTEKGKAHIKYIAPEGEYTIKDRIAVIERSDGTSADICMLSKWPVRAARPYKERRECDEPLITGQRVIDTLFPLAKGGSAAIPGSFGTGKTMTQHQLARWCDADLIVYIGCGERGNEMTEVLEDFPKLTDPRSGRSLMERTVLIANTSNMPVAGREASIYTGITIAEYYRDMGYHVAIMADSTSRWAEALREISGRLEEMPAEEGFPAYLPSRISEFYGRAGKTESFAGNTGSVSIIGAVSPQGGDFSEPVTQNTRRFVRCFWGLSRELAYSRHYPAISWLESYSDYVLDASCIKWFTRRLGESYQADRARFVELLRREDEQQEIVKLIGADVMPENQKLVLEIGRSIRSGFLQQNAYHSIDTYVPLEKQYAMMKVILFLYDEALVLIKKGIPISAIKETGCFDECISMKYSMKNDDIDFANALKQSFKSRLDGLRKQYWNVDGSENGM